MTQTSSDHSVATVGDEVADLYAALAGRLARIVRGDVRAPEAVIEDACQFAWSRLVHHRERIHRETALAWLVTTAVHEALKLVRRQGRETSLDELIERAGQPAPDVANPPIDELAEHRARLESIGELPERQQRLVWLQGLGLSYAEMAGYTGASPRTVERQLLRAKRALRAG